MSEITAAERRQRLIAVQSAIGTHAMEGIQVDAKARSIMSAFAEGQLSLDQFSAAMDAHARAVLEGDRVFQGAA